MRDAPRAARVAWRAVDGIVLLEKPVGLSSNAALQRVRRLYRAAKAGHTGSLDPLASGVLPLCFGEATKVAGYLLDADKTYRATLALGTRTATGDREGAVVEILPVPPLVRSGVEAVLAGFVGAHQQVPPMYSALKRDGEALYALARRGVEVERAPRQVRIDALELESLEGERLAFRVTCSKGTYVRTLGEDIARALGTCGHLAALERTAVGAFAGRRAYPLEALAALAGREAELDALLLPMDAALGALPAVALAAAEAERFRHGQALAPLAGLPPGATAGAPLRVYGPGARFLGLARGEAELLRPLRLVAQPGDSLVPIV